MALADTGEGLAALISHGGAAQDFVLQIVLPFASGFYKTATSIAYIVAFIGLIAAFLIWLSQPYGQVTRWFISVVVIVILLIPATYSYNDPSLWIMTDHPSVSDITGSSEVGSFKYPKSVVIGFALIGTVERAIYNGFDTAMNQVQSVDTLRNGMPINALTTIADQEALRTRSPELINLYRTYNHECLADARNTLDMNQDELYAVGLGSSALMGSAYAANVQTFQGSNPNGDVAEFTGQITTLDGQEISNTKLANLPAGGAASDTFTRKGLLVPSKAYWDARYATTSSSGVTGSPYVSVSGFPQFAYPGPNPPQGELADKRMFAQNCDELHDIVNVAANRLHAHFAGLVDKRNEMYQADQGLFCKYMGLNCPGQETATGPSTVPRNTANMHAIAMLEISKVINGEKSYSNTTAGMANDQTNEDGDALESGVKGAILSFLEWWKGLQLDLAAAFAMGIVALGVGILFVIFPLIMVFGLLPGRLESIGTGIKLVIFAKLTLLLMYIFLRLGAYIQVVSNYGLITVTQNSDATAAQFAVISLVIEMATTICILSLAPLLSYMLVFSETRGLSSLKPGGVAQSVARTGAIIAFAAQSLATRGVSAGFKATNNASPGQSEHGAGSSSPPRPGVPVRRR